MTETTNSGKLTINEDEILNLLQSLIRTKSEDPPGDTREIAEVIGSFLKQNDIPFEFVEPRPGIVNIIARLKGKSAKRGPKVLFNGHIDTVPAGDGWKEDPFSGEYKDGYVHGRGSVDMKGGITSALALLAHIKRNHADFPGEIIFTAVGDEEFHSEFGTKWLLKHEDIKADYAINCEPCNLEFALGNRGLLMVDILIKGLAAHGGRPQLGINAVHIAGNIITAFEKMKFTVGHDLFDIPAGSLSVVGIKGGDRQNVIPDKCTMNVERRLMPGESGIEALEEISREITAATGITPDVDEDKGSDIILFPEFWHEPFCMDKNDNFIKMAESAYVKHYGKKPLMTGKSAGTDASHLFSMGKMPTLIMGPGDYNLSHTSKERIEFSQVVSAAEFYYQLISELQMENLNDE